MNFKTVSNADNIWKVTVCDAFNVFVVVWYKCEKCLCNNIYNQPLEVYFHEEITISQWETVIVEKDGNSIRTMKKVQQNQSIDNALAMLEEQLTTFSIHNYTNIMQLHRIKFQKEHLKKGEIVNKFPSFVIAACPSFQIRSNTKFLKYRY